MSEQTKAVLSINLDLLRAAALSAEGARFELDGFEQVYASTGHFYGGLIMHENGHTIVAQQVLQPWADHIVAANPATVLVLIEQLVAARALLREVYEEGNLDIGDQVSKDIDYRIRSYLDACDTLGGNSEVGS